MRRLKCAFAAVIGLGLSGCALFNVDDRAAPATESSLNPNKFEVFFDPDGSNIGETATKIIQEVADNVREGSMAGVKLSVHSTAAGWDAHSQDLSQRRAEAVRAELIKDGVPPAKITTVDVGTALLVSTEDGVREPQNRRTEITLY